MTDAVIQGDERGTYSRARTSYVNGTRDGAVSQFGGVPGYWVLTYMR